MLEIHQLVNVERDIRACRWRRSNLVWLVCTSGYPRLRTSGGSSADARSVSARTPAVVRLPVSQRRWSYLAPPVTRPAEISEDKRLPNGRW